MTKLAAFIDVLLPGEAGFPSGSATQVLSWLAARHERFGAALETVLAALPDPLTEASVSAVEAAHPAAFASLLTGVYTAYYTDPAVRGAVEQATGYSAGPPQPRGYALPPFDPDCVEAPASRAPSWRKV